MLTEGIAVKTLQHPSHGFAAMNDNTEQKAKGIVAETCSNSYLCEEPHMIRHHVEDRQVGSGRNEVGRGKKVRVRSRGNGLHVEHGGEGLDPGC